MMDRNAMIITYLKLTEKEKRAYFAASSSQELLKNKLFAFGCAHLVILNEDGTVAAFGDHGDGRCDTEGWTDVVKVAAGDRHTVALRRDGTVLAAGDNSHGQCNVSSWKGVVDIFARESLTVGVRSDGSLLISEPSDVSRQPDLPDRKKSDDVDESLIFAKYQNEVRILKYTGADKHVVIPAYIQGIPVGTIAPCAFEGCGVESVVLPETLTTIRVSAFHKCERLKWIRIPDGVTVIDDYAFYECSSLRTVVLPDEIIWIGKMAFCNCPSLRHIYVSPDAEEEVLAMKKWIDDKSVLTVAAIKPGDEDLAAM